MSAGPSARAVLVIGDVMLDVVAAPHSPIERGSDTPADITVLPGGSGANTAAWLGFLGYPVRFAGRVGRDGFSLHARALRAHGVEPVLARDRARRTGILVSLVSSDGERSFLTDRGANAALARADLPDALLDQIALVHISGYALRAAESRAAVLGLLASAAARAIPISVDPGSAALLRDIGARAFLEWTRCARLCFPNAVEAALLTASSDPRTALTALARQYETVAIKRGPLGACAATGYGERRWTADAPAVAAVDTTGAGDAFVAGYLAAYLRGEDGGACVAGAVAAGSAAISHFGGRPPAHARSGRPARVDGK